MNFEPTSDAELASATFDNEVAGDERIHALADPAVVAEIASYQLVRDALNDVVVPATARASSIAAALAAFDELNVSPAAPVPAAAHEAQATQDATIVSFADRQHRRHLRQRQYKAIMSVAAAGVAVFAGLALLSNTGSDKKSATANPEIASKIAPTAAPATSPGLAASSGQASDQVEPAATAIGDTVAAPGTASAVVVANSSEISPIAPTAKTERPSEWFAAPSFVSESQLIEFASGSDYDSQVRTSAARVGTTTSPVASGGSTLSSYLGEGAYCLTAADTEVVPVVYQGHNVLVSRDLPAKSLRIVDPTTCAVTTLGLK